MHEVQKREGFVEEFARRTMLFSACYRKPKSKCATITQNVQPYAVILAGYGATNQNVQLLREVRILWYV